MPSLKTLSEVFIKNSVLLFILFSVSTVVSAATVNGFETSLYGFVRASSSYSSSALASFNNINMVAPTHAVAHTRSTDSTSRFGFQTQQSRVGTFIKKQELSAQLEFDFVDFSKSSPTTQMVPRVRIATASYVWENKKIVIGQDWDLFSPLNSYTYNYVGNYFLAGNSGFMRQQFQYLVTLEKYEFGAAIGMANSNPTLTDGDVELGKSPSYAARITRNLEGGKFGLSLIYARLKYQTGEKKNHDSYGSNLFFEKVWGAFGLKTELYHGMNLANIGLLTIGKGTSDHDVKEYGGHLTGAYKIRQNLSIFGGGGIVKAENNSEVQPFAPQGDALKTSVITSSGINYNFVTRIGFDYKITEDFSFLAEVSRFQTDTKLSDNKYKTEIAGALDAGITLKF